MIIIISSANRRLWGGGWRCRHLSASRPTRCGFSSAVSDVIWELSYGSIGGAELRRGAILWMIWPCWAGSRVGRRRCRPSGGWWAVLHRATAGTPEEAGRWAEPLEGTVSSVLPAWLRVSHPCQSCGLSTLRRSPDEPLAPPHSPPPPPLLDKKYG